MPLVMKTMKKEVPAAMIGLNLASQTAHVVAGLRSDGEVDAASKQAADEAAKGAGNNDGSDDDLLDVDANVTGGIHGFANDAKLIAMLAELEVVDHEAKEDGDDDNDEQAAIE